MHSLKTSALVSAMLAASLAAGLTGSALAQVPSPQSANLGLRPLTWAGRVYTPQPVALSATPETASQARANVLPRGGYQLNPQPYGHSAPAPVPQRQGLTPASAFYAGPAPRPVLFAPNPAQSAPAPALIPAPAPAPVQATVTAQAPAAPLSPPPAPVEAAPATEAPHDAMAPRRDAPIFRLGPTASPQPQPQTQTQVAAAPTPAPAYSHPRYYSVHRQYGRQPDPAPTPTPVYLDALPVDLTGMAGTSDLAEPPAPPTLIRNQNGRLQALPDLGDVGP